MGFWVNPNEGVVPTICEFDLYEVVATRATWSLRLENSIRAFAETIHMFQQKFTTLIPRDSGRAACFAEGSHFLDNELRVQKPITLER
jgi:hypothetical protein